MKPTEKQEEKIRFVADILFKSWGNKVTYHIDPYVLCMTQANNLLRRNVDIKCPNCNAEYVTGLDNLIKTKEQRSGDEKGRKNSN